MGKRKKNKRERRGSDLNLNILRDGFSGMDTDDESESVFSNNLLNHFDGRNVSPHFDGDDEVDAFSDSALFGIKAISCRWQNGQNVVDPVAAERENIVVDGSYVMLRDLTEPLAL